MEKKQSKFKFKKCSRLLIFFNYKKLFLFFFILYGCVYTLFALKTEKIKINYSSGILTTEDFFILKFDIPNYAKDNSIELPEIHLNDKDNFFTLEENSSYFSGVDLIIENKYRINKTGKLKLDNITVSLNKNLIKQESIELVIYPPRLSERTEFRWRVFDIENKSIIYETGFSGSGDYIITQGKKYFICLEGFFYNSEAVFPKITNMEYDLPENAVLEKIDLPYFEMRKEFGWNVLTAFFWTPVYDGLQNLPEFTLTVLLNENSEKKIYSKKKALFVSPQQLKTGKDSNIFVFSNNLQIEKMKTDKQTAEISRLNFENKIKIAEEIKKLRKEETSVFFPNSASKKRKELEQSLGFKESFSSMHFSQSTAIFLSFFFLITIILFINLKKRNASSLTYLFIFLISAVLLFSYFCYSYDMRKDYVCIPNTGSFDFKIYKSPEKETSVLADLKIGETVKVIYENNNWIYVEKYNGVKGWFNSSETSFSGSRSNHD